MTLKELLAAVPALPANEARAVIRAAGLPAEGELSVEALEAVALARAMLAGRTDTLTVLDIIAYAAAGPRQSPHIIGIGDDRFLSAADGRPPLDLRGEGRRPPGVLATILTLNVEELGRRLAAAAGSGKDGDADRTRTDEAPAGQ